MSSTSTTLVRFAMEADKGSFHKEGYLELLREVPIECLSRSFYNTKLIRLRSPIEALSFDSLPWKAAACHFYVLQLLGNPPEKMVRSLLNIPEVSPWNSELLLSTLRTQFGTDTTNLILGSYYTVCQSESLTKIEDAWSEKHLHEYPAQLLHAIHRSIPKEALRNLSSPTLSLPPPTPPTSSSSSTPPSDKPSSVVVLPPEHPPEETEEIPTSFIYDHRDDVTRVACSNGIMLRGLHNNGNACWVNSVLSLISEEPFSSYFREGFSEIAARWDSLSEKEKKDLAFVPHLLEFFQARGDETKGINTLSLITIFRECFGTAPAGRCDDATLLLLKIIELTTPMISRFAPSHTCPFFSVMCSEIVRESEFHKLAPTPFYNYTLVAAEKRSSESFQNFVLRSMFHSLKAGGGGTTHRYLTEAPNQFLFDIRRPSATGFSDTSIATAIPVDVQESITIAGPYLRSSREARATYSISSGIIQIPGHYYSFVKRDGKWWIINDSRISETSWGDLSRLISTNGVLLSYEKRSDREPDGLAATGGGRA